MSALYENIQALCVSNNISGAKLCSDLKISKSVLTSLKQGRTKSLSSEHIQMIAEYFSVTVDYLFKEHKDILSENATSHCDESESDLAVVIKLITKLNKSDLFLLRKLLERLTSK